MTKLKKAPTAGRRRKQAVKIVERNGVIMFECPFCFPPHPLKVGEEAPCGTMMELLAVQRLYEAVRCAKCGGTDGTLAKEGDVYQHTFDCVPGRMLLKDKPEPSMSARLVYHLPEIIRQLIVIRKGRAPARLSYQDEIVYSWMDV